MKPGTLFSVKTEPLLYIYVDPRHSIRLIWVLERCLLRYRVSSSKMAFVCYLSLVLFVCLPFCQQDSGKTTGPVCMKLGGRVQHGPRKNPLIFEWIRIMRRIHFVSIS